LLMAFEQSAWLRLNSFFSLSLSRKNFKRHEIIFVTELKCISGDKLERISVTLWRFYR
jgi:hypothetical protein